MRGPQCAEGGLGFSSEMVRELRQSPPRPMVSSRPPWGSLYPTAGGLETELHILALTSSPGPMRAHGGRRRAGRTTPAGPTPVATSPSCVRPPGTSGAAPLPRATAESAPVPRGPRTARWAARCPSRPEDSGRGFGAGRGGGGEGAQRGEEPQPPPGRGRATFWVFFLFLGSVFIFSFC